MAIFKSCTTSTVFMSSQKYGGVSFVLVLCFHLFWFWFFLFLRRPGLRVVRSARSARGRVASAPARSARASHDAEAWAAFRGKEPKDTPPSGFQKCGHVCINTWKDKGRPATVSGSFHVDLFRVPIDTVLHIEVSARRPLIGGVSFVSLPRNAA